VILGTPSHGDSEGLLRLVADNLALLVWISGTDKRCTYFNKAWLDFTGRPLESEIGDGPGHVRPRLRPS
jgi:PAS domain-containing protein